MADKILFIHIPKTAGKSIITNEFITNINENSISYNLKERYRLSEFLFYKTFKHLPYSYLDYDTIGKYNRFFSVVRNPWSRVVSLYHYADVLYEVWPEYIEKLSFDEFLKRRFDYKDSFSFFSKHPYNMWANQIQWVSDKSGKVNLDILRYEHLKNDISNYLQYNVILPTVNKGNYNADYRTYYNTESIDIVYNWYKRDIDYWGFEFETSATKNYWNYNDT